MSFKRVAIFHSFLILLIYGGLIISIGYFFDKDNFFETITSPRAIFAIKNTLLAATIATFLATIIALFGGYALSRYQFRGKKVIDTILEFPMVVSPAALGAILLIFFNNPLGEWIQNNIVEFVFTFWGIVLAQFVTIVGVAVRFIKSSFDEVSIEYEKSAKSLGASSFYTFFTITLPLAKKGIVAAIILSWAKAVGEFGATMTLAGTMAFKTETLPIAIYLQLENANIKGTVTLIIILIIIGLGALF
ncbi:MAG: ABC transporter permease subunit, partial [Epsilonproteobacteria bacterium]|nr:ABC transporter permease subunit [Campylobacterota bacterium]